MTKIAIDARMINSSTGRYVHQLLDHLQQIDHHNQYLVLLQSKDREFWRPTASNFQVVDADFSFYSLSEQFAYRKFLAALGVDLVHFCMPQQPIFYRGAHVTTVHDLTLIKTYNSDKNWFIYHFKQLVGRVVFYVIGHTSRHILTPSEFTREEYSAFAHIPVDKISVTHEAAADLPEPEVSYKLPSKEYLLYVGQQSDYKNIKRLILAQQELLATHPKLLLVLAGGRNKALELNEAWVQKHGYRNVVFTGFVAESQLLWLYRHALAYVFPSLMEGFGLPGLEAMKVGAPVISSNATCLPEIYGDAAYYFNPYSVGDMMTKIGQVITNEPLRRSLIEKGTKRASEFSWRRMAEQTLEIYKRSV